MRTVKTNRWMARAALLLLLAYALLTFSPLVADPDLWGHVRFGQDALHAGRVVQKDTYSYLTAGQRWINHEWLSEVLYALTYNFAGARGLILLNSALSLLIVGLIYRHLPAQGMGMVGALLLAAGMALLLRPGLLNVRPQVFTYLLFLLLLLQIKAMQHRTGRVLFSKRQPWLIVAFVILWVNLHGGVLAGIGILWVWGLVRLGETIWRRQSLLAATERDQADTLVLLVGSSLALLINPYGVDLITFLVRTATTPRPEILDWQGARATDLWGQLWLYGVALTVLALALSRRVRSLPLLVPLAVTALLPLLSVRHIPLFAVAASVLAAEYFADLWERVSSVQLLPDLRITLSRTPFRRLAAAVAFVAAVSLTALAVSRLQAIEIWPRTSDFPVRAVAVLTAAEVKGNMATEFNWGEYVIWHLGPGVQVSVDGRRETVYATPIYQENLDFMFGEGDWDRLLDRPKTELALVDRSRPAYNLMREKTGWILAYEDVLAAVFVREGSPLRARIAAFTPPDLPPDGAGLAFP